jgi:hypothetical protein
MSYPYTISTNDSLVQIDTRTASGNVLINLSTCSIKSGNITIRDIGGSTDFFNSSYIQISTLDGSHFNDMTSSHYIRKPYGYITVLGNSSLNQWNLQTEYDNSQSGTAFSIIVPDTLNISSLYVSSIVGTGPISTVNMQVSSSVIENGSSIATTVYWSTSIRELPTSGLGGGYITSSLFSTNIVNMGGNYKYISSSWLNTLNTDLAKTHTLVSSFTYISTLSTIGVTAGYMSTIVTGTHHGYVKYIGGNNVSCINASGKTFFRPNSINVSIGGSVQTLTNALQAVNISSLTTLKCNNIVSNNLVGLYNTTSLLNSGSISDRNIKTDIRPLTNALEKIRSLRGVSYTMDDNQRHIGLIAQEVEKIVPEVVDILNTPNNLRSLHYDELVGLLIEGVKELKGRLDSLESYLLNNDP